MTPQLTYLACPYSSPDPAIRLGRFNAANRAAAGLMRAGHIVFSPISMGHPISEAAHLPSDAAYWAAFNRAYLEQAREVVVLAMPGWEESVGVQEEIRIARSLNIPINLMDASWAKSAIPEAHA